MYLLSLNIYNWIHLFSPSRLALIRYLRAKLNFFKLYCIFLLLGQKKHKRIQFSVVFALFILI